MLDFGSIGFLSPLFFVGFLALPLLWWLLRATPPRPKREAFPGVRILVGLDNQERTPHRTPWWLLLLRMLAAALLLAAFAEPLLNPKTRDGGSGPLLVVMDAGWTSAPDWSDRRSAALDVLRQAREADREVALVSLSAATPPLQTLTFETADAAMERLRALEPSPWRPDPALLIGAVDGIDAIETVWFQDGLSAARADGADDDAVTLTASLAAKGPITIYRGARPALAMAKPSALDGEFSAVVRRAPGGPERAATITAFGAARAAAPADADAGFDPNAAIGKRERRLGAAEAQFQPGDVEATASIDLPLELRNALTRLEIRGEDSAGAVTLLDDSHRRRRVALVTEDLVDSDDPLLSAAHYLRAALQVTAAPREMTLRAALGLPAGGGAADDSVAPWADVIVLADIGRIDGETEAALAAWVEKGGLLIRFAGPRLAAAAAEDAQQARLYGFRSTAEFLQVEGRPNLLPVSLRGGDRSLGGSLSWSEPQRLAPFAAGSPFIGLTPPQEVLISRQVLAEPGPELSAKVWASLADGTPLVTGDSFGAGSLVLFHISARADWSSLPLSGLFVQMLGRLTAFSQSVAGGDAAAAADDGAVWRLSARLNGRGEIDLIEDQDGVAPEAVNGADLAEARRLGASALVPPGVYVRDDGQGGESSLALSAFGEAERLALAASPPSGAQLKRLSDKEETPLKPILLALAFGLLTIDILAALFVAGRLRFSKNAAALIALIAAAAISSGDARAAERPADAPIAPEARFAALESILGYIVTGDSEVDGLTQSGMRVLSNLLFQRTSIEPLQPAAIDLDKDDISVYSIIYWPITATQSDLSDIAIRKLNQYMRTGGFLMIDTRDAHLADATGQGPMSEHLKRLAGKLDLPPLEPMDANHLMTRTYYLTKGAPGRLADGLNWVQAGTGGDDFATARENDGRLLLNDGVSSVLIGGADWAGAWALDDRGRPLKPMSDPSPNAREFAFRFGVNIVIYAYTGSYKSDQVHIPDLLQRLGE